MSSWKSTQFLIPYSFNTFFSFRTACPICPPVFLSTFLIVWVHLGFAHHLHTELAPEYFIFSLPIFPYFIVILTTYLPSFFLANIQHYSWLLICRFLLCSVRSFCTRLSLRLFLSAITWKNTFLVSQARFLFLSKSLCFLTNSGSDFIFHLPAPFATPAQLSPSHFVMLAVGPKGVDITLWKRVHCYQRRVMRLRTWTQCYNIANKTTVEQMADKNRFCLSALRCFTRTSPTLDTLFRCLSECHRFPTCFSSYLLFYPLLKLCLILCISKVTFQTSSCVSTYTCLCILLTDHFFTRFRFQWGYFCSPCSLLSFLTILAYGCLYLSMLLFRSNGGHHVCLIGLSASSLPSVCV